MSCSVGVHRIGAIHCSRDVVMRRSLPALPTDTVLATSPPDQTRRHRLFAVTPYWWQRGRSDRVRCARRRNALSLVFLAKAPVRVPGRSRVLAIVAFGSTTPLLMFIVPTAHRHAQPRSPSHRAGRQAVDAAGRVAEAERTTANPDAVSRKPIAVAVVAGPCRGRPPRSRSLPVTVLTKPRPKEAAPLTVLVK